MNMKYDIKHVKITQVILSTSSFSLASHEPTEFLTDPLKHAVGLVGNNECIPIGYTKC